MYLPNMPCALGKTKKQVLGFSGINLTDNTKEGQLRDSVGVSGESYPYITVCGKKEKLQEYASPCDMFEYDGKLFVADGNTLYYDGKEVCNIQPGKKQFAVVNTKLCIFPDKITVDTEDGSIQQMSAEISVSGDEHISITQNSVTAKVGIIQLAQSSREYKFTEGGYSVSHDFLYRYGTKAADVESCWDDASSSWIGLEKLQREAYLSRLYAATLQLEPGDIIIPGKDPEGANLYPFVDGWNVGSNYDTYAPDVSMYNQKGYYGVVTQIIKGDTGFSYVYDVYQVGEDAKKISAFFEIGDHISVSGTPMALQDVDRAIITETDDWTNTVYFSEKTFNEPLYYCTMPVSVAKGGEIRLRAVDEYPEHYVFTADEIMPQGAVLFITGENRNYKVHRWDTEDKKVLKTYDAQVHIYYPDEETDDGEPAYTAELIKYSLDGVTVLVQRPIPDLDYICESENRLWGVSNKDNTIYASELGQPHRFYTYGTLSTDSYAVAVGSEGDFTAICAYGGGVCCFKENRLHKILGSYPYQYYMSEYNISGVQSRCERSLQIINETLYYKGEQGVFAYTGGTPKLISYPLGREELCDAASGTDGRCYYISGRRQDGSGARYAYDLIHGIWLKEENAYTQAFAFLDGEIHMLTDGTIYRNNSKDKSQSEFCLEFVPFCQDVFAKKSYTKLLVHTEMAKGAYLRVYVKQDNGEWRAVFTHVADSCSIVTVPMRIGRCNTFGVKLEGRGDIKIKGMLRECAMMSER